MRDRPDLILVSLDQSGDEVAAIARRVRLRTGLAESVPIVMFSILTIAGGTVADGKEVLAGENTYATRPVNFSQLRKFLSGLLRQRLVIR